LDFQDRFSKDAQISKFMKIGYIGVELFHAEEHTNMTMLTFTFRYFANRPKNCPTIRVQFILCCMATDPLLIYEDSLSFSRSFCCELLFYKTYEQYTHNCLGIGLILLYSLSNRKLYLEQ
jgi:hypothetical protein